MPIRIFALLTVLIAAVSLPAASPASPGASHTDIAAELCRQARDREDVTLYDRAEAELQPALKLADAGYDARKLQATILLGKHEFQKALTLATALNHKVPDDIAVWSLLAEINSALGNDAEALRDAQWVLNIRPGSTLGFVEAARLRELHGDLEGARDFYDEARRRISFNDTEEHSWLLTQAGRVAMEMGDTRNSEALLTEAMKRNPASELAVAAMANLLLREKKDSEAISLFQKRAKNLGTPESLYDLANALDRAGRTEEAGAAYLEFRRKAEAQSEKPGDSNILLIRYYAARGQDAKLALPLAEREIAIRHDPAALEAYALALDAAGRPKEAMSQMKEALAPGIRNASYFCHAAGIASHLNDAEAVAKFRQQSRSLDPDACAP